MKLSVRRALQLSSHLEVVNEQIAYHTAKAQQCDVADQRFKYRTHMLILAQFVELKQDMTKVIDDALADTEFTKAKQRYERRSATGTLVRPEDE